MMLFLCRKARALATWREGGKLAMRVKDTQNTFCKNRENTQAHTHLNCNPVFERHAHVTVRVERTEGAKLRILQQQHGLWSQTHSYHGDDVGVLQLVQDGHLRLKDRALDERITSQLASTAWRLFLSISTCPKKLEDYNGLKGVLFQDHIFPCACLAKSSLDTRL